MCRLSWLPVLQAICVKLPILSGEQCSGYQGCGLSSTAQLLNACQVKADGTTGDYKYILTAQSCTVHVCEWYLFDDPLPIIAFI